MKKSIIIAFTFLIIVSFSAFTTTKEKSKYPVWKNLQILPKDISKEALDSVMTHFSISLGVRCGYCHARTEDNTHLDFATDSKGEKKIARKMMLMTDSINNIYFSSMGPVKTKTPMVTCYTCHRGQEQPEAAIPDSILNRHH